MRERNRCPEMGTRLWRDRRPRWLQVKSSEWAATMFYKDYSASQAEQILEKIASKCLCQHRGDERYPLMIAIYLVSMKRIQSDALSLVLFSFPYFHAYSMSSTQEALLLAQPV